MATITPDPPNPPDDGDLDAVIQALMAQVSGIPGKMIFPRWQSTVPQQPPVAANWLAIGDVESEPDDGPYFNYDNTIQTGVMQRGETMRYLASFYGPNAAQYAALARDNLAVPQNLEMLLPYSMRLVGTGAMRRVPALVNEQWIKGIDMPITFRRNVRRTYSIQPIASAEITVIDDTYGVDRVIDIPPSGLQ